MGRMTSRDHEATNWAQAHYIGPVKIKLDRPGNGPKYSSSSTSPALARLNGLNSILKGVECSALNYGSYSAV